MAFKLGDIFWFIKGDTKDIDKKLNETDKKVGGLQGTFGKLAGFLKGAFVVAAVAGIAKVGKELITAASDAEETRNKFNVTFRDIKEDAEAAAEALAEGFGLSQTKAQDLLAATGDLLSGFGFTQTAALDLSTQINTLAGDLGSFQNLETADVSRRITAALTGETDGLKALGVVIRQDTKEFKELVEQTAAAERITTTQAKSIVILNEVAKQSANSIGDFARSQGSFANQSKIASGALDDLQVVLGQAFLPIATQAVTVFADIVKNITQFVTRTLQAWDAQKKLNKALKGEATDLESAQKALQLTTDDVGKWGRNLEYVNGQLANNKNLTTQNIADLKGQKANLENLIEKGEERIAQIQGNIDKLSQENVITAAAVEITEAQVEATDEETEALEKMYEARANLEDLSLKAINNAVELERAEIRSRNAIRLATQGQIEEQETLNELTLDFATLQKQAVNSTLSGFTDLGAALVNGEDAFQSFGVAALGALAEVLNALGGQLAAIAATNTALFIASAGLDVAAGAAIAPAAIGAAAAFTAAGAIGAAASNIRSTPTAPAATTSTGGGATTPAASTGGSGSRGGGGGTYQITINNLISTGKEADIRAAVRAQAPYIVEELVNRGDI